MRGQSLLDCPDRGFRRISFGSQRRTISMELLDMSTGPRKRRKIQNPKTLKVFALPMALAIVASIMYRIYNFYINECSGNILFQSWGDFELHICGPPLYEHQINARAALTRESSIVRIPRSTTLGEVHFLATKSTLLPHHLHNGKDNVETIVKSVAAMDPAFK